MEDVEDGPALLAISECLMDFSELYSIKLLTFSHNGKQSCAFNEIFSFLTAIFFKSAHENIPCLEPKHVYLLTYTGGGCADRYIVEKSLFI